VAAYPKEILVELDRKVMTITGNSHAVGVIGRTARTGKTQNVGSVKQDIDYVQLKDYVQSQLAVPIRFEGRLIGVISIEHPDKDAFSEEDVKNRHYKDLSMN
jgi:putative methionine-R-sulfoxide reductase with GAF domain